MSDDNWKKGMGNDGGLPPEVADFLREVIGGSLLRFEILRFFHHNPFAILTTSDFAVFMSREEKPLAESLQRLAKLGYLFQSFASSAYVFTSDPEKRLKVGEFFDVLEDHPELAREIRRQLQRGVEAE